MTLNEFQLAGFTNTGGVIGAAVPTGKLLHPGGTMKIQGNALVWTCDIPKSREITPPDSLLDDFIQLWDSDDRTILRFAMKWGPLAIDRKGNRPSVRREVQDRTRAAAKKALEKVRGGPNFEPLAAWRFFSRRAYSVLRIAAALYNGDRGDIEDWKFLASDAGGDPKSFYGMPNWRMLGMKDGLPDPSNKEPYSVERLRYQIAGELNTWIERYEVVLTAMWRKHETPRIEISYRGHLLAAIALQVTLAVMKEHSIYTCSGCGVPYSRGDRKRPKEGDSNFCEKCGRTEALRQAQKRRRERIAIAKKMSIAGDPVEDIATKLGTSVETARKWVKGGQ